MGQKNLIKILNRRSQKFFGRTWPLIIIKKNLHMSMEDWKKTSFVATLALGLRLRQGLVRVWAKREAWESHFMLSGV
jgi:hypothetical protein